MLKEALCATRHEEDECLSVHAEVNVKWGWRSEWKVFLKHERNSCPQAVSENADCGLLFSLCK